MSVEIIRKRKENKMVKIKVLSVHVGLGTGGSESLMINSILPNLNTTDFHMDFVTHSDKEELWEQKIISQGSKVIRFPKLSKNNIKKYISLWNVFFKENNYDLVHLNYYNMAPFIYPIANKYGVKVIVHAHTSGSNYSSIGSKLKWFFGHIVRRNSDCNLACSINAGKFLYGNKGKFEVIKNGVSVSKFAYGEHNRFQIRSEMGVSNDTLLIGTVGRISEAKNPEFIVKLIEELSETIPNFLFLWVGKGQWQKYEELLQQKKVHKKVVHLENRVDIPDLLSSMDIFILPSKVEGFGIAALESQLNGLPTICSENVPHEIAVVPNKVKFLSVEGKNSLNKWIKEIEKLAKDNEDRAIEMNDTIFEYDSKNVTRRIETIYRDLTTDIS